MYSAGKKINIKYVLPIFLIIVAGLVLLNNKGAPKKRAVTTASQTTKGELGNSLANNKVSANSSSPTNQTQKINNDSPGQQVDTILLAPSGDFVSNHRPNLSGDPSPNRLTSVCNTTPGATCTISFSKDGLDKSLEPEVADSGGSVYWNNWSLKDLGLTEGSWKVRATATFNGQVKISYDAQDLVVSQ